jgi:hypothetical protein
MKWLIVCISLGNLSKIWIQSQNFLSLKLGFGSLVSFFFLGKRVFTSGPLRLTDVIINQIFASGASKGTANQNPFSLAGVLC